MALPGQPSAARGKDDGTELLAALYDEYAPALYRYALGFLRDAQRAQDVVQEVLLRAWRNPDKVDPATGSPRGWLFTVARNVLTDQWRAEQSRPREVHDEPALLAAPADDVVDRLVESWTVEAALQRLSFEHRSAVVQVHVLGRSVEQAAAALGIAPGTLKSRTFYGVRALRTVLIEMGAAQ